MNRDKGWYWVRLFPESAWQPVYWHGDYWGSVIQPQIIGPIIKEPVE